MFFLNFQKNCFSIKLALGLQLYEKETLEQVFLCEISQIFNNIFLQYSCQGCFIKLYIINCNTKFFESSAVLWGGREYLEGLGLSDSIGKSEVLG